MKFLTISKQPDVISPYEPALKETCNKIIESSPDVIIALSRKGPRLLEILKSTGLLKLNVPILTEKAAEILPNGFFDGKSIVIFDDIIISGTTLAQLSLQLKKKHTATIKIIAVAVDKKTIKLKSINELNYVVESCDKDGFTIPVYAFMPLEPDTRFGFCDKVVRSFLYLNKPYDIDFPIFYGCINEKNLRRFTNIYKDFKPHSVATARATSLGYERITYLPLSQKHQRQILNSVAPAACEYEFYDDKFSGSCAVKTRVYWETETGDLALTPMVTFFYNSKTKIPLFSASLDCLNKFIDSITHKIDGSENVDFFKYRIYWYVVNFLFGYFTFSYFYEDKSQFVKQDITNFIQIEDILLIFGQSIADELIGVLNQNREKIYQTFSEQMKVGGNSIKSPVMSPYAEMPVFDIDRGKLLNQIETHISERAHQEKYISRKIASVFEAMFYIVENETQKQMKMYGFDPTAAQRLEKGFNSRQLYNILTEKCGYLVSPTTEQDILLTYDYLIDLGIMIPLFYRLNKDHVYERVYRYGEDALSLRKFAFFVADCLQKLQDLLKRTGRNSTGIIPRITFEKIGVVLLENLRRNNHIDVIATDPLIGEPVNIDFTYSRHGKVLDISINDSSKQFIPWCIDQGIIITIPGQGIASQTNFLDKYKTDNGYLPAPVSSDLVFKYAKMGWYTYIIDREIDTTKSNDMVVSITTCRTHREYLRSIREELRLFFESPKYRFETSLSAIETWQKGSGIDISKSKTNVRMAQSAISDMQRKQELWKNFMSYVKEVDNYILNNVDPFTQADYQSEFRPYLSWLEQMKIAEQVSDSAFSCRKKLECLGDLCLLLSNILVHMHAIIIKVVSIRTKQSKDGANDEYIYISDFNTLKRKINDLNKDIKEFNRLSLNTSNDSLPGFDFTGHSVMPTFCDEGIPTFKQKGEYKKILLEFLKNEMANIILNVREWYNEFKQIFNINFRGKYWENTMSKEIIEEAIKKAIFLAEQCVEEDQIKPRPKVGAVIIKNGEIVSFAHRGEGKLGDHAEFVAIRKAKDNGIVLKGATIVTTLEPCTSRSVDKTPCAEHIVSNGFALAVMGQLDPNPEIRGLGTLYLKKNGVAVELFPAREADQAWNINTNFNNSYYSLYHNDVMTLKSAATTKEAKIKEQFVHDVKPAKADNQFVYKLELNQFCIKNLEKEDIRTLCVHLKISFSDLAGEKVSSLAAQLIREVEMRDKKLDNLIIAIKVLFENKWMLFQKESGTK